MTKIAVTDSDELGNLDDKPKWGGPRPNSGRPKGSMNPATKTRVATKAAFQDRVARNADRLFNSQFNLATGEQYLMWKHEVGSGAKTRTVVEIVEDPEIIKSFLDDTLDQASDEYYFISTKPANNMALDSLLNRSFGKADEKIENSGEQKIIIETRRGNANHND